MAERPQSSLQSAGSSHTGVQGAGCKEQGAEHKVHSAGYREQDARSRVYGAGCREQRVWCMAAAWPGALQRAGTQLCNTYVFCELLVAVSDNRKGLLEI